MKEFRVHKSVKSEPQILGLSIQFLFIFLGLVVIAIFLLSTGFTLKMIGVCAFIVLGGYLVLRVLHSGNFLQSLSNDKFPDIFINDNYK